MKKKRKRGRLVAKATGRIELEDTNVHTDVDMGGNIGNRMLAFKKNKGSKTKGKKKKVGGLKSWQTLTGDQSCGRVSLKIEQFGRTNT